jgi:hypothetical protein
VNGSSKKRIGSKEGAKGTSRSPRKNTKLLEFSEDISEMVKKKGAGTHNISSGRVQLRAMAPVMIGVIGKESNSMVT